MTVVRGAVRFGAAAALLVAAVRSGRAAEPVHALAAQFAAIAARTSGTLGVTVVHVETGERAAFNGGRRFPMFSTYKVAIALQVLRCVERGTLTFDRSVDLGPADLRLGSSPIAVEHPEGSFSLPVAALLDAMILHSDNTASDALLHLVGGPAAVTARLRELGIVDVRVDRSEAEIAFAYRGVRDVPPPGEWTLARLQSAVGGVSPARAAEAARAFVADPRDTATPDAMADLLVLLAEGRAADAAGTARLLAAMAASPTGAKRLKGSLPAGTVVAHKTGTGGSTAGVKAAVNDVGLVTLPDGRGRLAIAVFVQDSQGPVGDAERTIAAAARAAYEHWVPSTGR